MTDEAEVFVQFAHSHDGICTISVYLDKGDAHVALSLSVPVTKFQAALTYLGQETGRHFRVQGDTADAQDAEVTCHAK